ncbi:hypothetical protein T439DRAFT_297542 [Meredithblackwellia eburnea MCA 4105]
MRGTSSLIGRLLLKPPATTTSSSSKAAFSCSCRQLAPPSSSTTTTTTTTPRKPPPPPPGRSRTDLDSRPLRYLKSIKDLAAFDPTLDIHPSKLLRPTLRSSSSHDLLITHINDNPLKPTVTQPRPAENLLESASGEKDSIAHLASITDLTPSEIGQLVRFPLIVKRVVNMKSKGKMPAMYALVVVGNQNGLVGVGEGKDDTAQKAVSKAFNQAVRSMDYVERYEDRTVWGTMESNFGSCKIQMRSRPPGFGLRVNHYLHQVAKAAGISDLSAKVYGSRNGTRVIKLACQMLHGGSVPVDMGEFGHKGQRRNKKVTGMRTAEEVGRSRGRLAVLL